MTKDNQKIGAVIKLLDAGGLTLEDLRGAERRCQLIEDENVECRGSAGGTYGEYWCEPLAPARAADPRAVCPALLP